jgi:GAF domain-containing protein
VIGVLDVHSVESEVFDDETVYVLQIVSDQLAVAILNIRLLDEMTRNVDELQRMYGTFTQDSWINYQQRTFDVQDMKSIQGYRFRRLEIEPILEEAPLIQDAIQKGCPVIQESRGDESGQIESASVNSLAVPVKVRGQTIGAIEVQLSGQAISPEIVSMYEEIASRLALVFENARLLQDAQNLARREQQINFLSSRIRNSINMDTILQNTVRELGKAFGSTRTFLYLGEHMDSHGKTGTEQYQAGEQEMVK